MWSLIWIQPALQSRIHKVEFMLTLLYELVLFYLYLYLVEFIFKFIWEEYKFETAEHQNIPVFNKSEQNPSICNPLVSFSSKYLYLYLAIYITNTIYYNITMYYKLQFIYWHIFDISVFGIWYLIMNLAGILA